VRLHILANSDSAEDQRLKLMVRDRVLEEAANIFSTGEREDVLEVARENLGRIEEIVLDEISKQGYSYGATAEVGRYYFPTRDYGDIVLPAGEYDAVRVLIGEGKGQNWWCVVFPPLCVGGTRAGEAEGYLEKNLDRGSYEIIQTDENKKADIQFKFKIVELFSEVKEKLGA
jgi:stage II sporulation protein R